MQPNAIPNQQTCPSKINGYLLLKDFLFCRCLRSIQGKVINVLVLEILPYDFLLHGEAKSGKEALNMSYT